MPSASLAALLLIAGLARPLVAQAPSLSPLTWRELSSDGLTPEERQAIVLAPSLQPAQWGLARADLTIDRTPVFFLEGKIGNGTGYGYVAAFGFRRQPLRLIWSGVTLEYLAAGEFVPQGWTPFVLKGCLFTTPQAVLTYVPVVDSLSPTALEALRSDTLVRPAATYGWDASGQALVPGDPATQDATLECRASLARHAGQ